MQRINLSDSPDQRVSAVLDSRRITFRFRFNPSTERWHFDLALDDQPIIAGRRIVAHRNLIPGEAIPGRLFAYVYGSAPSDGQNLWFVDGPVVENFDEQDLTYLVGRDLIPFGLYDGRSYNTAGGVQPTRSSFVNGEAALFYISEAEVASALASAALAA